MAVSPEQLRSLRFDEGLRGYDKRQVDKVIARVADLLEELQTRLADAESRLAAAEARAASAGAAPRAAAASQEAAELDEQLRRTLILAQRTADAAIKEARDEAAQIRAEAEAEAGSVLAAAQARAEELSTDAEQRHAAALAEADDQRNRVLAEARQHCEDRIAAVEAELAQTLEARRDELLAQIAGLDEARDALAADVELLEGHVSRRRHELRTALDELAAMLDDPAKLQDVPPPPLRTVDVPDPAVYEPTAIQVAALADLTAAGASAEPEGGSISEPQAEVEAAAVDAPDEAPVAESAEPDGWDGEGVDPGPATELHPIVVDDEGVEPAPELEGWAGLAAVPGEPVDEPARPAWADAVPAETADQPDPFLDELRRASAGGGEDGDAMERFFGEGEEDRRTGWFRRKA